MKKLGIVLGVLMSAPAWAAERYTVIESIDVLAPAAQVWDTVKGFDSLDSWHPAVTKTEMLSGSPTERGAMRLLTIGDGAGTVKETLTAYDDEAMSLSYVINETDIVPVKDYASSVKVLAVSDSLSLVIWSGDFLSNPPEGAEDSASEEAIVGIYSSGLEQLKGMLEQ